MNGLLLIITLTLGCVTLEPNYSFTLRSTDMSDEEFVEAAAAIVLVNTPEWYVAPDGPDVRLILKTVHFERGYYATTRRMSTSSYLIFIESDGLSLKTIEELAAVLLHEYVHVKTWNSILGGTDLSRTCKVIRSEMMSESVVIANFYRIGYSRKFLYMNIRRYRQLKHKARLCPPATLNDLPSQPFPVKNAVQRKQKQKE